TRIRGSPTINHPQGGIVSLSRLLFVTSVYGMLLLGGYGCRSSPVEVRSGHNPWQELYGTWFVEYFFMCDGRDHHTGPTVTIGPRTVEVRYYHDLHVGQPYFGFRDGQPSVRFNTLWPYFS